MARGKKKEQQNNNPKSKKKLLIILIPIVVILLAAAAAAAVFVPKFLNKDKKKVVVVKPPEFYFTKKDAIDSVSVVLGARRFTLIKEAILAEETENTYDFLLGTGTVIAEPEEESETESLSETADTAQEESAAQAESTEPAEEATQEESATAPEESASETETAETVILEVYQYYPGEISEEETESATEEESAQAEETAQEPEGDAKEEVAAYLEYLQNEKSFIDITQIALNMGVFAQEETEEQPDEQEETEGPLYYVLTGPAADADHSLVLSVICNAEYYQIRTWTQETPWTQQMSLLWEERDRQDEERRQRELEKEQGETEGATEEESEEIDTIEELVSSLGQEALKLSHPIENYEFIYNAGGLLIHGKSYSRVGAYYMNEKTKTPNYECTFLVDENGEVHYKYHDATGEIESLDEEAAGEDEPAEEESTTAESESETESQES